MGTTDAVLTSEIQRALQHAIGEANSSFGLSAEQVIGLPKKRKKKRGRDKVEPVEVEADEELGKDKKKKRKRKDGQVGVAADGYSVVDRSTAQGFSMAAHDTLTKGGGREKRRRKVDKGKQRAEEPSMQSPPAEIPIDPQLTAQSNPPNQASTAAFLSALVAAASATSDPQHPQDQMHPPLAILPNLSHYSNYPPYYTSPQGYPPLGVSQQPPLPTQAMFPPLLGPNGSFISDGAFANLSSNDDILRVLQELDLSKIAIVLRSLGDAASAANVPLGYGGMSSSQSSGQSQDLSAPGQLPVSSAAILGHPPKNVPKPPPVTKRMNVPTMPLTGHDQDPEHAHLLANKWMNAGKLAELVRTQGLVYKKGKFSTAEEAQITFAIENYRVHKGLTHEQLNEIIFAKGGKQKDSTFWSEITSQCPQRPIIAVYHHVRRTYHPMKQQGKWMPAEDEFLKIAVAEVGQSWEKVSARVGRMAADCRDRWRNHINHRENRVSGQWSIEEEEELTRIVTEMTIAQGKDQDNDVFWGQVSQRMGNRRGRQQCRIKWTDSLSKTLKNEGEKPRWGQQDGYVLVHKISSLNVRDDSEIDWKLLSDSDWNLWSAHSLQRRWLTLKRSIRGYEEMSHQEIMDILRVKKGNAPPPPPAPRKSKVVSAPLVLSDVQYADNVQTMTPVRAATTAAAETEMAVGGGNSSPSSDSSISFGDDSDSSCDSD